MINESCVFGWSKVSGLNAVILIGVLSANVNVGTNESNTITGTISRSYAGMW